MKQGAGKRDEVKVIDVSKDHERLEFYKRLAALSR